MNLPQLFEIGSVQRTHGVNGEIQVNWTNDFNPDENKLESVFIEIDGIPIPFSCFQRCNTLKMFGGNFILLQLLLIHLQQSGFGVL
jgi:ribosomal 30S subunit maturation factor RimM